MARDGFAREVVGIAAPVALQSMLQSSFSMIDQVMVGQLGEESIAAVEIAGKPGFIFAFVVGAVGAIAGIMVSQYIGQGNREAEERGICVNLLAMLLIGAAFLMLAEALSAPFVRMFSGDEAVVREGGAYLQIIGWAFIPLGISNILGVAIRCRGKSAWPLCVGAASAALNTALNECLIFGRLGLPRLGVVGAAWASVISQMAAAALTVALFFKLYGKLNVSIRLGRAGFRQYMAMLMPVVVNEFMWAVGQSVNTYVYGHMGTEELAGMSLTGSVQGLTIGALSGLSQAAGILIGKRLGERNYDAAYEESKKLCACGLIGAAALALVLAALRWPYVGIYRVSVGVRRIGAQILLAFAVLMPVKVENMILGGGIIRSGGKTKYVMAIDLCGTWLLGVPLALLCGLVWKLPIVWVYFILSQEELARLIVSVWMFRGKRWMNTLE